MTTVDSRRPLLTSANPELTGTGTSLPLFVAKGWIAKGHLATGWIAKGWIAVACSANGWIGAAGILRPGDLNEAAAILRPAERGRQPGKLRLETARSVRPGQAAQIDDRGPVFPRIGTDEYPAPPDQERQQQAGQRRDPGDQGRQLSRVVGDGQADPLPVAGEGGRPRAAGQFRGLADGQWVRRDGKPVQPAGDQLVHRLRLA